jgi:hypothetical protein
MSEQVPGWSREFDEPIALPGGEKLVVLRDAANYITALPTKEATPPEWQAAIETLILVVDLGGPTMFARIGIMRALSPSCLPRLITARSRPRGRSGIRSSRACGRTCDESD